MNLSKRYPLPPNSHTFLSHSVCLLNAGGAGSETLKNLVLPGIGKFTIVDDRKVSEEDCSNNFFVTKEQIGESR